MNAPTLIGNARVLEFLRRSREREMLAHAALFVGPVGIGKMAAARAYAAELLGGDPAVHPDFNLIERERDKKTGKLHGSIVIEQVRQATARLASSTLMGGWKLCILDGADMLQEGAANALLKSLEEPTDRTLFILLAEDEGNVMPTIRSRCQVLRFSRVPEAEIAAALRARGLDEKKSSLLARLADGRPGAAIGFLEDPESLARRVGLRNELIRLHAMPIAGRWSFIERLIPAKTPFQESIEQARALIDLSGEVIGDALRLAAGQRPSMHLDAEVELATWVAARGADGIAAAGERLGRARKLIDANVSPRAVLEEMVLSF